MRRWEREAWSGLLRGKNWISRPFEEHDAYPVWVAQLTGISTDLIESLYATETKSWKILGAPQTMVFEWQARSAYK